MGRPPSPTHTRTVERATKIIKDKTQELEELQKSIGATDKPESKNVEIFGPANPEIWATDIFAQPKATYRYRLRLVFTNPLFAKTLPESQAQLAQSVTVNGAWSNWTDPIEIPADLYLFIVSTNPSGHSAKAELYKFHAGFWYTTTIEIEPGDRIGTSTNNFKALNPNAPELYDNIDFNTGLTLVDLDFNYKTAPDSPTGMSYRTTRILSVDDTGNPVEHILLTDRADRDELIEDIESQFDVIDEQNIQQNRGGEGGTPVRTPAGRDESWGA